MRNHLLLLLCFFGISSGAAAQDSYPLMNFMRVYAFADRPHNVSDRDTSTGLGGGGNFTLAVPYSDFDPATDKVRLGWLAQIQAGYGKVGGSGHWIPYVFDIGMWGSYYASRDFEAGLQYSFLGIYGYNRYAFFGSSMIAKVRVWRMQVEVGREGAGLVSGFIAPKFNSAAIHHYGIYYNAGKVLMFGFRYIHAELAEKNSGFKNGMSEYRFTIGVGFNEF